MTALVAIPGCKKETPAPGREMLPALAVRVQTVESRAHPATEEIVGTVQAKLHAVIEAKVSGRIDKMLVAPGQSV